MIVEISKKPKKRRGFASPAEYNRDQLALHVKVTWEKKFNLANPKRPELEMELTAAQNPWCRNLEFKFVISWPYGERPSQLEVVRVVLETLREASKFCCYSDGEPAELTELELVLDAHDNTDHFHVHGLLNAIHPVTHRKVEMNVGYDQILFQHSLRIVESRLDWSSVPNNPRYAPMKDRNVVIDRLNPLSKKPLGRGQASSQVFRNEQPPELALRKILLGIRPEILGSPQDIDRFLQSRSINYQTVKKGKRSKSDPNLHSSALFTLDGHRIPSGRIRDDRGRPTWTPAALRKILPKLPPAFELGYPLSKMTNRRKRKSKMVTAQEWQIIAAELKRTGLVEIRSGRTTFGNLGVQHFIIHADLPNFEFRDQPNPIDRAVPTGQVDRFPVSSFDELEKIAEQLRVAEDRGALIKFLPVREGVVYAAAVGLDEKQLQELKQDYTAALVMKEAGGNYSVLVAVKALPDRDTCMAALRLLNAELHSKFHTGGLPPPPIFPLVMPGFRPTLGEWLPGDPPVAKAELLVANRKICPAASKRLEAIGRHYTDDVLPRRGTLFAFALRRLALVSTSDNYDAQLIKVATSHLTDLQAKATPPANWEEVDRCLALRLRLAGLGDKPIAEFITKIAPLTRPATESSVPGSEYGQSIAAWTMQASDTLALLQDMATEWRAMAKPALDVWLARKAERFQQAVPAHETSAIKAAEPSQAEKIPTAEIVIEDTEEKFQRDKPSTPQTR